VTEGEKIPPKSVIISAISFLLAFSDSPVKQNVLFIIVIGGFKAQIP